LLWVSALGTNEIIPALVVAADSTLNAPAGSFRAELVRRPPLAKPISGRPPPGWPSLASRRASRIRALEQGVQHAAGPGLLSALRPSGRSRGSGLPSEQGVGACGDDAEDPACGREVLGREVEQPSGDLLKSAADPVVGGPACIGKSGRSVAGHQPGGGQLG